MKKPFIYALLAVLYIMGIGLFFKYVTPFLAEKTFFTPIAMLGLLVLSVATMGFLFFSEPIKLYIDNRKQEAVSFFLKMLGVFACFVVLFFVILLII